METEQKILKTLLKDFSVKHTVTSIAKEIGLSRVGTWKVLKRLEYNKLIFLLPIGSGKTSTYSISLNWDNILMKKKIELYLMEEAQKNQRWLSNFTELNKKCKFLILFGSVLHSPKEANDIDILCVTNKNKFTEINGIISKIQKTNIKNIHPTNLTEAEFKEELLKQNKVFIDILTKGVVLFGQENLVRLVKEISVR